MKIISSNIGQSTIITWNGKKTTTGIYKYPVKEPLLLDKEHVAKDTIADRNVHGGIFKACYLFSADHYPYWKEKYPHLRWDWGMFGENLTVEGLDETNIRIGNIYKLGSALVQITQPREPCYKLGVRFQSQEILREFIDHGLPGTYVRILEVGKVIKGDHMELVEPSESPLTIHNYYKLLFSKEKHQEHLRLAIAHEALPPNKREKLKRWL